MVDAIRKAGKRETGGILMGEHVSQDRFRILDITIQRKLGTFGSFIRVVSGITLALKRFFQRTNYEYTRFNYLGEWHSHPSFSLEPSSSDYKSMLEIVSDPVVGANFAVLMIIRLNSHILEGAVFLFFPGGAWRKATVVFEEIKP